MGSVIKSGTSPIAGVLAPGSGSAKRPDFAATPASDFVCGTRQLASGMTLHVFTTGRGTPTVLPPCRSSGIDAERAEAALARSDRCRCRQHRNWQATIEDVGWEIFRPSRCRERPQDLAEHWNLSNALALFNPGP
jgi:galactarate dehydratase